MGFCYDTAQVSVRTDLGPSNFDPLKCDATRCYLDHYKNSLVLTFFSNNGTIVEKAQARQEMEICERKMNYWKRQPHFDKEKALREKERLHKKTRL